MAHNAQTPPTDLPIRAFHSADAFEKFLERENSDSPGIWLKLAKKSAGIISVSFDEALDIALCYGWINGQGLPYDGQYFLSRYTPRRPKSLWSKRNVDAVSRLEEVGRMRHAGIVAIEAAKADGRWDRAYASPSNIKVPDDFAAAVAGDDAAREFFDGLNKTERYAVLWRVHTATPSNRTKCIDRLVNGLADSKVPGRSGPAGKPRKMADGKVQKARTAASGSSKATTSRNLNEGQVRQPRRTGLRPRT